jgi:hypothetical protein
MKNHYGEEIGQFEKLLLEVDHAPWDALYRTAIGAAVLPLASYFGGQSVSTRTLVLFLVLALFMMRLVPTAIRKLVPFPRAIQQIWADRRQLAKRYDSYQWRKVLWIGAGLSLYMVFSGQFPAPAVGVSALCVLAGIAGQARWQAVISQTENSPVRVKPERDWA